MSDAHKRFDEIVAEHTRKMAEEFAREVYTPCVLCGSAGHASYECDFDPADGVEKTGLRGILYGSGSDPKWTAAWNNTTATPLTEADLLKAFDAVERASAPIVHQHAVPQGATGFSVCLTCGDLVFVVWDGGTQFIGRPLGL